MAGTRPIDHPPHDIDARRRHHRSATGDAKIAGIAGTAQGARLMAGRPGAVPGPPGQYELVRQSALGSVRALPVAVARDPATFAAAGAMRHAAAPAFDPGAIMTP